MLHDLVYEILISFTCTLRMCLLLQDVRYQIALSCDSATGCSILWVTTDTHRDSFGYACYPVDIGPVPFPENRPYTPCSQRSISKEVKINAPSVLNANIVDHFHCYLLVSHPEFIPSTDFDNSFFLPRLSHTLLGMWRCQVTTQPVHTRVYSPCSLCP